MTSLRARFALLLVGSIVGVVALASLAAFSVMRPPPHDRTNDPVAMQIRMLVAALAQPGRTVPAGIDIRDAPLPGRPIPELSGAFGASLGRAALPYPVEVVHRSDRPGMAASVRLGDGRWLVVPIPDFSPPPGDWRIFAGWIALIALGAAAVAIYFAALLTRPLEILRAALSRVGPDGVLAPVPEEGPAEVRATAAALNRLSSRLKAAMESRMRLVAAAGHDLRTPMTRMRLRAEFLPEEERAKWLADLDELERIAHSAIRLVREGRSDEATETVALDGLVRNLVGEMEALGLSAQAGRIESVPVRAGALGLRRALRNLLVNGATHGKGCIVEVAAEAGAGVITIADRGPGIPAALIDQAFEPFFRVDPGRRQAVPGAGLGLAIAKEIVERQGGSVTLANRPGGGLVQTVRLRRAGGQGPFGALT